MSICDHALLTFDLVAVELEIDMIFGLIISQNMKGTLCARHCHTVAPQCSSSDTWYKMKIHNLDSPPKCVTNTSHDEISLEHIVSSI